MMNCCLLNFKKVENQYGNLVPIEQKRDIPFDIKRVYYIYNVKNDVIRGNHAHRKIHQVLICVNGSVKIRTRMPKQEEIYQLNNPSIGLYIGTMIWREMFDFSEDCVLLVIASDYYEESDYIRNFDFYIEECNKWFKGE